MLGIGMSVTEGTVFSSGTAGWFGLPRDNFVMDATNGEIVSAVEGEGISRLSSTPASFITRASR